MHPGGRRREAGSGQRVGAQDSYASLLPLPSLDVSQPSQTTSHFILVRYV